MLSEHPAIRRQLAAGDPDDLLSAVRRWWGLLRGAVVRWGWLALLVVLVGRRGRGLDPDVAFALIIPMAAGIALVLALDFVLWSRAGRLQDDSPAELGALTAVVALVVAIGIAGARPDSDLAGAALTVLATCCVVSGSWAIARWSWPQHPTALARQLRDERQIDDRRSAVPELIAALPNAEQADIRRRRDRAVALLSARGALSDQDRDWASRAPLGRLEEHMRVPPSLRDDSAVGGWPSERRRSRWALDPCAGSIAGSARFRGAPRYRAAVAALALVLLAAIATAGLSEHPIAPLTGIVGSVLVLLVGSPLLRAAQTELMVLDDWLDLRGRERQVIDRAEVVRFGIDPGASWIAHLVHGRPGRPLVHPWIDTGDGRIALRDLGGTLDEVQSMLAHVREWRQDRP